MKHIAIILAGGIGSRVGGNTPKQLLPLEDGRSVLEHAVDAFEQAFCIDEIAIVMHPDWIAAAQSIIDRNEWRKVRQLIPGGKERWESSYNAVMAYESYWRNAGTEGGYFMWFHDCARPFVSQRVLSEVAEALEEHPVVTVAVPVTDTLYRVQENTITDIPPRQEFMRAQTPQAFFLPYISCAYIRAKAESATTAIPATDDIGIFRRAMPNEPIYIVSGDESNKKITYPEDL